MQELVLVGAGIINLGLGYFVGQKLTTAATDNLADTIHQLGQQTSHQLDRHLRRIDVVDNRLRSHLPKSIHETQLDDEIRKSIIELRDANRDLHGELERTRNELRSLRLRPRRAHGNQIVEVPPLVENVKLSSVTPQVRRSGDPTNQDAAIVEQVKPVREPSLRKPFDVEQLLAPFDSGVIPAASDFQTVKCWDIGSDGFSFLLRRPPTFKTLILVLTKSAEKTYLSARVVQTKTIVHHGIDEYHVDCQFISRLPADSFR